MHVLTCGTFDLFHPGHLFLLRECRKLTKLTSITSTDGTSAGGVVVGLNPDDFAATYGKPAPVMTYDERAAMLNGCRYVDRVIENVHGNTMALLEEIRPGFLVIGQDWANRDYYTQIGVTQTELDQMGVSLLYVPRPDGTISSTEIKARIAAPHMQREMQPPAPLPVEFRSDWVVYKDGEPTHTPRPSRENVSTAPRTAP